MFGRIFGAKSPKRTRLDNNGVELSVDDAVFPSNFTSTVSREIGDIKEEIDEENGSDQVFIQSPSTVRRRNKFQSKNSERITNFQTSGSSLNYPDKGKTPRSSLLIDENSKGKRVQTVKVLSKSESLGMLLSDSSIMPPKTPQGKTEEAQCTGSKTYPTLYRLEASHELQSNFSWREVFTWRGISFCLNNSNSNKCFSTKKILNSVVTWSFKTNLICLMCAFALVFIVLTGVFALVIDFLLTDRKDCFADSGEAGFSGKFYDAYSLSWTTLSTVGYGIVAPASYESTSNNQKCYSLTLVCALESFVGVLYASFCGAVIFTKVIRVQSHARVIFSDPLLIRFGSGVEPDVDDSDSDDSISANEKDFIPFPELVFRIANKGFYQENGEIVGASIKLVAAISKIDDVDKVRFQSSEGEVIIINDPRGSKLLNRIKTEVKSQTGNIFFHNMKVQTEEHPFFKRVWRIRHTLNCDSPLLTRHAKRLIEQTNGGWPSQLNNHGAIRRSLVHFEAIVVNLSGVSNASAANVFANKIYRYVDLRIGYQFAPMLYRNNDDYNSIAVNLEMINDVFDQRGGGGERLQISEY